MDDDELKDVEQGQTQKKYLKKNNPIKG